jgi:hypothetical protein
MPAAAASHLQRPKRRDIAVRSRAKAIRWPQAVFLTCAGAGCRSKAHPVGNGLLRRINGVGLPLACFGFSAPKSSESVQLIAVFRRRITALAHDHSSAPEPERPAASSAALALTRRPFKTTEANVAEMGGRVAASGRKVPEFDVAPGERLLTGAQKNQGTAAQIGLEVRCSTTKPSTLRRGVLDIVRRQCQLGRRRRLKRLATSVRRTGGVIVFKIYVSTHKTLSRRP